MKLDVAAVATVFGLNVSRNLEEACNSSTWPLTEVPSTSSYPSTSTSSVPSRICHAAESVPGPNHHSNGRARPVTRPDTAPGKSLGGVTD